MLSCFGRAVVDSLCRYWVFVQVEQAAGITLTFTQLAYLLAL
jgi:hypothetical protein